jgi:hypothetical protein
VTEVRPLSDGTLALDYHCSDVSDQETAKNTLNQAVKHDDVKKTIAKSSKTDTSTAKQQEKPAQPTKAAQQPAKNTKPSKPSEFDCDKDHKVTVQDDKTVSGVLVVKSCHATRFNRKPSRCSNVGNHFGSLVNSRCGKAGIKDQFNLKIQKTVGDKTKTEFHYTLSCDKSHQKTVIDSLKDACKDKTLQDKITNENQPDENDSSSESDEKTTAKATPAKVTQKETPAPTPAKVTQKETLAPAPATQKPTTKAGKTLKPSKPSDIDCDKDHKVTVQDDKTVSGVLVVKSCHATRFNRKPSRCSNVGNHFGSLVNSRCGKAGIKDQFNVKIQKTLGDKTKTEFHYTLACDKAHQKTVIDSLKDACKDKTLTDKITNENQPDENDSSSESDEKTTAKATPAKMTQKETSAPAPATQKPTTKAGKTLKPSKPSDIECDKDHKVTAQDDKTVSGVLVVKSCHATRFNRKPSRCSNVGNHFGSLVNSRCGKAGIKDKFNVKILKTVGDKTKTEFHYTLACDKAHQKTVIDSLKDACKDKTLTDTITNENQPDEDDSSSESSEKSTKPAATHTESTVPAKATSAGKTSEATKAHTGKYIVLIFKNS